MNLARLIVLNTVGAGLVVAAHMTGALAVLVGADKFFAIPLIGVLVLLGLWLVGMKKVDAALWLSDKLPVVGLALTVLGLLWADPEDVGFKRDIIHALVGNFMGVIGYAWLELNARVCK